ncbi:hypothetical protein ABZU32_06750 [Sphaerisporangium sp. NPDC005288]|uniref:hypothetical protein n=1 Tax=Sphaerisporangium sp. NPDC005288 TaxID=3155114 RepID=UPI0033B99734
MPATAGARGPVVGARRSARKTGPEARARSKDPFAQAVPVVGEQLAQPGARDGAVAAAGGHWPKPDNGEHP